MRQSAKSMCNCLARMLEETVEANKKRKLSHSKYLSPMDLQDFEETVAYASKILEKDSRCKPLNGTSKKDACKYEDVGVYDSQTVVLQRCSKCGHEKVSWYPTDLYCDEDELPIILCRECANRDAETGVCAIWGQRVDSDEYCSRAEEIKRIVPEAYNFAADYDYFPPEAED